MREFVLRHIGMFFACWYLWLPITFWFGRVFCRYVCPLGLMQSLVNFIFHPKTKVRRVCTRLPRSKWQRIVNWVLVAIYFLAPMGYLLNPWGIFGRGVLVWFVPGMVTLAIVLALAIIGKGRVWCNWVCPIGTIFELTAKLGWHQDEIAPKCKNCRRCFGC